MNRKAILIEASDVRGLKDLPGARVDIKNWKGYLKSLLGGTWTDTEIKVRVPQVAVSGTVLITRGSWDMLPDGTCCKDKEWVQSEAGFFTPTGLDKITSEYMKKPSGAASEGQ